MVAKSEASMPMSRALAKLAVATDLGTAARPSTAVPLSGPVGSSSGSGKAPAALPGRSLALKPSAAWAAPASGPPAPAPGGDSNSPLAGATCPSAAPRLPPLPLATAPPAAPAAAAKLPSPPAQAPPPHTLAHLPPRSQSLPPGNTATAGGAIGEDLLEAARKHPGLPASLLAQLHHPRRAGSLPSAPLPGLAHDPGGADRPLSARARALATAAAVHGASSGAAAAVGGVQPLPAAVASLSPAALALLLAPPQVPGAAGGAGGGVLTMRRAAPVVGSAGAALRPSTAGGSGSGVRVSSPGTAAAASPRPPVQPHTAVPYKPGSIRLPPSAGATSAALGALHGADRPAVGALGSLVPAAAVAQGSGPASGLRPPTSNPLTHSLAPDPAGAVLVRVPKPGTGSSSASVPVTPATDRSPVSSRGVAGSGTPPAASTPGCGAAGSAAGGAEAAGAGGTAQQLSAEELRAVVAALAKARPQTAAVLLRRPSTTGQQAPGSAAAAQPARPGTTRCSSSGPGARTLLGTGVEACGGGPALANGPREGMPSSAMLDPRSVQSAWTAASRTSTAGSRVRSGDSASSGSSRLEARPGSGGVRAISPPRPGSGGSRTAATGRATATARRALQSIPEDAELAGGADAPTLLDAVAAAQAPPAASPRPLEPLESDPVLDAAWAAIVAANLRPDSAAVAAPGGSIDVFSRPGSSAPRCLRQAAPMVLVLDDIAASTPEVVEHELAHMSLEQLQELRTKLMG